MSRLLLLADSNYLNNIKDFGGRKIKDLEVKSCQNRRAAIAELGSIEEGIIVVSCLDMMAADIAASAPDNIYNSVELYLNQFVFKLIEKVDEADGRLAVGVVAPLFWTSLPHEAKRGMNHAYKSMRNSSMTNIWFSEYLKEVHVGADGTHLTRTSSKYYIQRVHELFEQVSKDSGLKCVAFEEPRPEVASDWAEEVAAASDQDAVSVLRPPEDNEPLSPARTTSMLSVSLLQPASRQGSESLLNAETQQRLLRMAHPVPLPDLSLPPPMASGGRGPEQAGPSLDRRVAALESAAYFNNLTMAALKEEQDTEANKAMLNRVSVSGLVIEGIQTMAEADRIQAMRAKIQEVIDQVKEPDQVFEIQFVRHLNRQRGQKYAVVEVKFADVNQARLFRDNFVKKRKELPEKVNVTPVVRLATRVRVEIMYSICTQLKRHDPTIIKAMCLQYVPKPVIKTVSRTATGGESVRTMTFIDAIRWVKANGYFGKIDLNKAYDRAGASFRGVLAQNFVLMD